MGLEQFDIAPDNHGGRPEKPKSLEGDKYRGSGKPYVQSETDEQWWLNAINQALDRVDIPGESVEEMMPHISELASHTHTSPLTVWKELDEHGLIDMDWDEYKELIPDHLHDDRVPGVQRFDDSGSSGSIFGSGVSTDSGLGSLVSDAK